MSHTNKTKTILKKLDKLITSIILLILVLIALYVTLSRQLILWVSDYKPQLMATLSEQLHTPVTIDKLEGRWGIISPIITANNILIGQDKQNLKIDKLVIKLDVFKSIINRQIRIAAIYGDNIKLQIRESNPNFWSIGGIPRQKDPITPEIVLTQLQRFEKISVTNSTISIYPYKQPVHTFNHVNATLTHFNDKHMKLAGILYTNENKPFVLSIDTLIDPKKWQQLKASIYADIPYVNWQKWIPKNLNLPWDIKKLIIGGEVWATVKGGQVRTLTFNTKHNQLIIKHDKNKTVHIKDIAMEGWFNLYKQQYIGLQIEALSFITENKLFKDLDLLVTRSHTNSTQWQIQANSFNISDFITPLLAIAPLPSETSNIIRTLKPEGTIKALKIDWFPEKPLTEQFNFSAQLEKVSFQSYQDTVGAGNITGQISGGIKSGKLKLDANDFWLHIASLYSKAWTYQHAKATLNWSFKKNVFSLFSPLMKIKGNEGDLTGDMMIRLYPKDSIKDYMDLRVSLVNGDASYTPKYIPSKAKLDPELLHWLNTSIKSGYIEKGFFQYQGSIDKRTPPTAHTLLLYMKPKNAVIDYQAPWPAASKVDGEVFVTPAGVKIIAKKGTINNSQLSHIHIDIPHVAKSAISQLHLTANINSHTNDILNILKVAPKEVSHVFKNWQGQGKLVGDLKLAIPLSKHKQPNISTNFKITNGQLNLQYPIPPLTNISGNFHFDINKGLSSDKVIAYTLGQRLQANISAIGEGKPDSLLKIEGNIDLVPLANWYAGYKKRWPFSGKTPYELQIKLADINELTFSSQLEGITFNLPAPFDKPAKQKQTLNYHMSFSDKTATQLQINYGNLVDAAIRLNNNNQLQGEFLVNQGKATLSNKQGLQARANLNTINLEEWKDFYDTYLVDNTANISNKKFNINALRSLDLRIGEIRGFNLPPQQLALYLQPTGQQGWRLDMNSPLIAGRVTAPQIKNLPYYVNLNYLKVPKEILTALDTKDKTNSNFRLSNIPNLDLFIHQLYVDNDLIGTINLYNKPSSNGLLLSNMDLNLKGLHVEGNLDWQVDKKTHFIGKLSGKNIEDVLKNWHIDPSITAQSFKVIANGSWPNNPNNFTLENFTGSIKSELKTGRLLTIDKSSTNLLRVFGIFNSDAITRRLRLDFSDLFKSGLTYDHIKGEFTVNKGVYRIIKPITIEGPSMLMSMTGQLNMNDQQINAKLKVGVPIGSNLSIATLAIVPPIGGAMLIVDHFLGDELMRLASITYHIKGDWSNPNISLSTPINK